MFREQQAYYSMDDQTVFGQMFSTSVSFSKAVELGRIVPIRLHLVDINDESVRQLIESSKKINITSSKDDIELSTEGQKYLALASIAARQVWGDLVKTGQSRKAIAFMGRTTDCARAIDTSHPLALVRDESVASFEYHSGISMKNRKKLRHQFAKHQGPALMTAVRAIREGVSINDVDTVILLRGYGSDDEQGISAELIQHIGRAVRKADGKTHANVIIPIPSIGVADSIRQRVLQMVIDLAEQFDIMGEYCKLLADGKAITAGALKNIGLNIIPPSSISESEIIDSLSMEIVDFTKRNNAKLYQQIKQSEYETVLNELADLI